MLCVRKFNTKLRAASRKVMTNWGGRNSDTKSRISPRKGDSEPRRI